MWFGLRYSLAHHPTPFSHVDTDFSVASKSLLSKPKCNLIQEKNKLKTEKLIDQSRTIYSLYTQIAQTHAINK